MNIFEIIKEHFHRSRPVRAPREQPFRAVMSIPREALFGLGVGMGQFEVPEHLLKDFLQEIMFVDATK